ncbi:MAG: DsrE family protein [Cytophagales bacterium]|nr:DsrE family protein [Cytophagales bacterium]
MAQCTNRKWFATEADWSYCKPPNQKQPRMLLNGLAKGVVFAACNNTMKRRKLTKADLLPTATVVPSAMIELTLKQEKGWAYVKGAH